MRKLSALVCTVLFLTAFAKAQDNFVWIEAETPNAHKGITELNTWGHEYLSGHWLHISVDADKLDTIDGDAILLQYDFESPAGTFELWNRIGLEYIRSPFDWRIDDGEWKTAKPDDLTMDLMEIGFWCEIAWLKLGDVELTAGKHSLEIRIAKRTKPDGSPDRIIYASDCLCLYPGQFQPYSKYKPNEDHLTEKDIKAAEHIFKLEPTDREIRSGMFYRNEIPLNGTWEICRDDEYLPEPVAQPISQLPHTTRWSAIEVPGDKNTLRPDLQFAHRIWYRTRVYIPEEYSEQGFFIEFPKNNLNTTVYVNGQLCGFNKNPFAKFQIDISHAMKPGVNEIYVGIRDAWYARTEKADDPMKLRRTFNIPKSYFGNGFQDLVYPIWNHPQSGILVTPKLIKAGSVYVSDVFVKTSVEKKAVEVEVTVKNTTDKKVERLAIFYADDENVRGGTIRELFSRLLNVSLEPFEKKVFSISHPWENPVLWTPGNPHLYRLHVALFDREKTVDPIVNNQLNPTGAIDDTTFVQFGFREWSIDGKHFLLNGVPYRAWADCFTQPTKEQWLQFYRDSNQTAMRFWGTTWQGMPPEEALKFFDENGVVVRRSGIFDGQAIGYNAIENDPALRALNKAEDPAKEEIKMDLFRNWRDQMVAQVKGERNHPSIMLWSLENEILYINCINLYGGLMDAFEDEIIKGARMVKEVDPTRSSMVDGGGATKRGNPGEGKLAEEGSLPTAGRQQDGLEVHGDHYVVGDFTKYPDLAYEPHPEGGGRGRWIWDQNRPRFIGEEFYVNGYLPADFAAIGGESAFGGRTQAREAVGILLRMMTEGYRWNEYGGWHFWTDQHRAVDQYKSNAPIAVFCKEYDWTFEAGSQVERTFKIFNDTQKEETIFFDVQCGCGEAGNLDCKTPRFAYGRRVVVPAGRSVEFTETLQVPVFQESHADDKRGESSWTLRLSVEEQDRTGRIVFEDRKDASVLRNAPAISGERSLLVYDPNDSVTGWLDKQEIRYQAIDSLDDLADTWQFAVKFSQGRHPTAVAGASAIADRAAGNVAHSVSALLSAEYRTLPPGGQQPTFLPQPTFLTRHTFLPRWGGSSFVSPLYSPLFFAVESTTGDTKKHKENTILLIGTNAVTPENCDSTVLQTFAAQGNRVIVLEQKHPLRYSALPCEMEPASNEGRIGFMENESHPVFAHLRQKDFFTWTDGHILYRDAYKKPARGAKSLLQCDRRLENSAVVEVPVGQGVMILSQLLVSEKLEKSVVAKQLLGNMIQYAADYQLQYTPVIVCTDGLDANFLKELDAMQLKYKSVQSPNAVWSIRQLVDGHDKQGNIWSDFDLCKTVVILAATPENLKYLLTEKGMVFKHYGADGTILLHGLTPEGLAEFNQLVGVDHLIREFRRERVALPLRRSPLTQGLTLSDVAMSSGQRLFGWASDEYVASDTYSYVVDLYDIAPFATYRNDFEQMMSNGMLSADGWPYIVNLAVPDQPPFDFAIRMPKTVELTEVTWWGNTFYYPTTKIGWFFDGKSQDMQLFDVAPNTEPHTFALDPPLVGDNLTLRLADWQVVPDKGQLSGLDNIELKQKRPDDFDQRVKPLLNIGAMVHYPKQDGAPNDLSGIVLCNLKFLETESVPLNAVKKRNILATILRNLDAEFVESESIAAGTLLVYTPVNMAEKCNGFRSARGWLDNNFTFEAMPSGLQKFAGVTFDVYAFPTSPVPDCVIIRGENVEGIAVNQKGDALFFLHTMRLDARRNRNEIRDGKLFETLKYVVRYEDGEAVEIPIYAEQDIEHFRQSEVTAIPGAMLGWVRREEQSGDSTVAYVKQWNNPHPEKTITAIDIVRGAEPRGQTAVLAITVGSKP